jgi:excisionase family DNA binding protein
MSAGDVMIEAIADAVAERLEKMNCRRKRLVDLEEAAEYLGLSTDALRSLIEMGRLHPVRPTRKIQFDLKDLDQFIDELKKQEHGPNI